MGSPTPLQGVELISCAKANAQQGLETAAQQCGYGENIQLFQENLVLAGEEIGVNLDKLSDLITVQQEARETGATEIAPDTASEI
jgi:hypothetical protein